MELTWQTFNFTILLRVCRSFTSRLSFLMWFWWSCWSEEPRYLARLTECNITSVINLIWKNYKTLM